MRMAILHGSTDHSNFEIKWQADDAFSRLSPSFLKNIDISNSNDGTFNSKTVLFNRYLIATSTSSGAHAKGQIISKRFFFLVEDSSKNRTKTRRLLVKTNSFVRFLGESKAWTTCFRN